MSPQMTLILGGARSGKSHHAQQLAEASGQKVLYVATAQPGDDEMRARIAVHQAERPAHWQTLEITQNVGEAIAQHGGEESIILIDCITLLVSNILLAQPEDSSLSELQQVLDRELLALLETFQHSQAEWIVVSNEVGLGLVPDNRLGRLYRDLLGRANQRLAQSADRVLLMVAGLPLSIKE